MDDQKKTIRAKIVRDFADAGTETRFTAGQTVDIEEGSFANYQAAGLVEAADEAAPADGGEPATKTGRKGS